MQQIPVILKKSLNILQIIKNIDIYNVGASDNDFY